jgi:flagellar biosynthesis GTPase FlhF
MSTGKKPRVESEDRGELSKQDIEATARWLREGKACIAFASIGFASCLSGFPCIVALCFAAWSGLESHEGVLFEKRVHFFHGADLIDRLCSLSSVAAVVSARDAVREERISKAEAERQRLAAEAAAKRQAARKPPTTEKEKEAERKRQEREQKREKQRAEEESKKREERKRKNALLARKRTFRNKAVSVSPFADSLSLSSFSSLFSRFL